MQRSKKVFIAIIVIALAVFTSNIIAQSNWCKDDYYGMKWWNTDLPTQYQLSADQIAELNNYRTESNQKIIPLQKELRALQIEMRGYINRSDSDPDNIRDYRNQIRDIQDEIADIRINARDKMNDVFTDNQQVYFNDSRVGWWGGFYERCGWDYEDMTFDTDYGYSGRGRNRKGCW